MLCTRRVNMMEASTSHKAADTMAHTKRKTLVILTSILTVIIALIVTIMFYELKSKKGSTWSTAPCNRTREGQLVWCAEEVYWLLVGNIGIQSLHNPYITPYNPHIEYIPC